MKFFELAQELSSFADGLEIDLSCPHSQKYGQVIGQNFELVAKIVKKVKKLKKPVLVKISPNIRKKGFKEKDHTTRELLGEDAKNYAPLGTLFELSTMVFLDGVIVLLMKEGKVSEEEMKKRHANLE